MPTTSNASIHGAVSVEKHAAIIEKSAKMPREARWRRLEVNSHRIIEPLSKRRIWGRVLRGGPAHVMRGSALSARRQRQTAAQNVNAARRSSVVVIRKRPGETCK